MPTIYLPDQRSLTTDELSQADRPEVIRYYSGLPSVLQHALDFSWQWLRGYQHFTVPTSGSTGPPKRMEVSRSSMVASIRLTQEALRLTNRHTALLSMNPNFIGGKMMLARGLHIGMDMVWVPPSSHPLRSLPRRPDFLAMVPLQLQTILDDDPRLLAGTHATLVGGAPVSLALEEAIRTHVTAPVYATYGMTETLSHIALRRLNGPEASPDFAVLGDTQIGTDKRGCLTIRGAVTHHQLITTNDLVEIIEDQQDVLRFRWRGRYDWVINSGGIKVSPEGVERIVEQQLQRDPKPLPRFFVAGVPDERLGERVVLFMESDPWSETEQHDLLRALADQLPPYHAPREIRYLRRFAETPTGKIDRRATIIRTDNGRSIE